MSVRTKRIKGTACAGMRAFCYFGATRMEREAMMQARRADGGQAAVAPAMPLAGSILGGSMALLGLLELILSFTVIYTVLQAPAVATAL
jgi:hypothetical protein